jgi:hypothetical protein
MGKKNKHVSVKSTDNKITLQFDPMFYVNATRRETPPPTKVEAPKKGKGSYNRKEKHKKRYHSESDGISFLFSSK